MDIRTQEPKNDKDEELVRKVNEFLNNPPMPGSSRGGAGGAGGSGTSLQSDLNNIGDEELQNLLNNMSQHQLVQLLGEGPDPWGGRRAFDSGSNAGRAPSLYAAAK